MSDARSGLGVPRRAWRRRAIVLLRTLLPGPAAWAFGAPRQRSTRPRYVVQDEPWWAEHSLLTWLRARDEGFHREYATKELASAEELIVEVPAIELAGDPDQSKTVVLRLEDEEYFFAHWSEYRCDRFFSDSLVRCAAAAYLVATDAPLRRWCETVLAGPLDRDLAGWQCVAADWWDENGEEEAAADLRKLADYEREHGPLANAPLTERLRRLFPPHPWSTNGWDPIDVLFR